jgi:hypothetical protein
LRVGWPDTKHLIKSAQAKEYDRRLFQGAGFTDTHVYEFMKAGKPGGMKLALRKKGRQKAQDDSKVEEEAVHRRLSSRS